MDLLDTIALWSRKLEPRHNPRSVDLRFNLADLLLAYDRNTILELTQHADGKTGETRRPDVLRKLKISLLDDGVSGLTAQPVAWYEVDETAPSGDYARVRIRAVLADGASGGEVRMLVAQRNPDLYFRDDPGLQAIADRSTA